MIALDTDTTGIDFRHGSMPFLVTVCGEDSEAEYWEWDVDPLTRRVDVPPDAVRQIAERVEGAGRVVMHNSKFDVKALELLGWKEWDWSKTDDTLIASHLLDSGMPHDLTSQVAYHLDVNIGRHESLLRDTVMECRRYCQTKLKDWKIAKEGDPSMPSAGGELWRNDYWLPRALAKHLKHPPSHPWWSVLSDYAVEDSTATVALWRLLREKMERRGLLKLYAERMRFVPVVASVQDSGLTYSGKRMSSLKKRFVVERDALHAECVGVADSLGYELTMPKGSAVNGSLQGFAFDVLKLEPVRGSKSKSDTPSLAKEVLEGYLSYLDPDSLSYKFVKALLSKRSRDTAVGYIEQYERFSVGTRWPGYRILHPRLNETGSRTLRLTSSNPNEQNISKKKEANLRLGFGPPPGYEWWSLDAKNIELRIPFYKCGQKELIALFEEPDAPPYYGSNHLANCHAVYTDVWEALEKEVGRDRVGPEFKKRYEDTYYRWGKNGGFCKQYGGQKALTDKTFRRAGAFDMMEAKFDKLTEYTRKQVAFARKHGYVETVPDRRIDPTRGYPIVCDFGGGVKPTLPLSYHVQGTAMWLEARGMVEAEGLLSDWRKSGFDARMVIQVHDEVVVQTPRGADPVKNPAASNLGRIREVQKLFEGCGADLGLPTPFGVEYTTSSWAEGVTL